MPKTPITIIKLKCDNYISLCDTVKNIYFPTLVDTAIYIMDNLPHNKLSYIYNGEICLIINPDEMSSATTIELDYSNKIEQELSLIVSNARLYFNQQMKYLVPTTPKTDSMFSATIDVIDQSNVHPYLINLQRQAIDTNINNLKQRNTNLPPVYHDKFDHLYEERGACVYQVKSTQNIVRINTDWEIPLFETHTNYIKRRIQVRS